MHHNGQTHLHWYLQPNLAIESNTDFTVQAAHALQSQCIPSPQPRQGVTTHCSPLTNLSRHSLGAPFCPNVYPPPRRPQKIYWMNWCSTCGKAASVWTAWRIPVCWTHTFVLHDAVDNVPHRIVFTHGVVHIWSKDKEKQYWINALEIFRDLK